MMEIYIRRWYQSDCTIGRLTLGDFECFVLELPDLKNKKNVSCIPEGTYLAKKRFSPNKKQVVIEYIDVPNRTHIQMHKGNSIKRLRGCQAVGNKLGWLDDDKSLDVIDSKPAFDDIMALLPDKEIFKIHIYK